MNRLVDVAIVGAGLCGLALARVLVAQGLAEAGHAEWAERIRRDSASLIKKSGFFESFSPEDGSGSGGPDFSWTAAMWLAWCGTGDIA